VGFKIQSGLHDIGAGGTPSCNLMTSTNDAISAASGEIASGLGDLSGSSGETASAIRSLADVLARHIS
jgi:hypothetical protein